MRQQRKPKHKIPKAEWRTAANLAMALAALLATPLNMGEGEIALEIAKLLRKLERRK